MLSVKVKCEFLTNFPIFRFYQWWPPIWQLSCKSSPIKTIFFCPFLSLNNSKTGLDKSHSKSNGSWFLVHLKHSWIRFLLSAMPFCGGPMPPSLISFSSSMNTKFSAIQMRSWSGRLCRRKLTKLSGGSSGIWSIWMKVTNRGKTWLISNTRSWRLKIFESQIWWHIKWYWLDWIAGKNLDEQLGQHIFWWAKLDG